MAVDELGFVRETLARIEGKVDALGQQLAGLSTDHATLRTRVEALEKTADRRWQLVPTWIATGVALALAAAPYLTHV